MEQKELFVETKKEYIKKLILKIYQVVLLIKVKMDILDFTVGACLQQKLKDKVWYLVIYYSYKIIPLELNYDIYNKVLLVIVIVLKEQRVFLQGITKLFIIKMDYKNLIGFLMIKELN